MAVIPLLFQPIIFPRGWFCRSISAAVRSGMGIVCATLKGGPWSRSRHGSRIFGGSHTLPGAVRRLHVVWLVQPVDQLHTWWLDGATCRDVIPRLFAVCRGLQCDGSPGKSIQLAICRSVVVAERRTSAGTAGWQRLVQVSWYSRLDFVLFWEG